MWTVLACCSTREACGILAIRRADRSLVPGCSGCAVGMAVFLTTGPSHHPWSAICCWDLIDNATRANRLTLMKTAFRHLACRVLQRDTTTRKLTSEAITTS